MTKNATSYAGFVILSGSVLLVQSLLDANGFPEGSRFAVFCTAGILASMLKVRLPGVRGTMSANFFPILIGLAMLSLAENVVLAVLCGVAQCVLRSGRRPSPLQTAFNAGALAIASALSYRVAHLLAGGSGSLFVLLPVAAPLYFATDTLLVAGVISLVEAKGLFETWKQCYLWSFAYYLVGAGIAGLVVSIGTTQGWAAAAAIAPGMYMVYLFYKGCVEHFTRPGQPEFAGSER